VIVLFVLTVAELGNVNSKILTERRQNGTDSSVGISKARVISAQRVVDGNGTRRCIDDVEEDPNPMVLVTDGSDDLLRSILPSLVNTCVHRADM
jgi:hypothetical protein